MLIRLSIKQRMFLIIGLFLVLFTGMVWLSVNGANTVRDLAVADTKTVMLEDQKAKLKVATHSVALAIGQSIKSIEDKEQKTEAVRQAIDEIRFETDKSGYYFVYQGTVNVALPPKKKHSREKIWVISKMQIRFFLLKICTRQHPPAAASWNTYGRSRGRGMSRN